MLTGFRAGPDPALNLAADDFAGTRRAWSLPDGTAPIGRVFPDGASITPALTPGRVVAKVQAACVPVLAAGMWPYVSLKPDVAATLAGQLDAHMVAVARWAAGLGVPMYFSVWHEPENDTLGATPGDLLGRAANFVKVHSRIYAVMKTIAGDALRMGPCHLVYQWAAGFSATADGAVAAAWRVPDDRCDFYAADSYTSNWTSSTRPTLRQKADFQRWLNVLAPTRSKVVLAERGISRTYRGVPDPAAAQALTLFDDVAYLRELGAHALLYWNSGGASDDSVYLLDAPGRAVFRQLAIDAATVTQVADRYQDGFDAGRIEGIAAGRAAAFTEAAAWATSKASAV